MIVEFFPTLVEPVDRSEESDWIRNVNGNRNPETATCVPHRIEASIIDLDELVIFIADNQTERFQNLQPMRAIAMSLLNRVSLHGGVPRLVHAVVKRLRELQKAPGKLAIEFGHPILHARTNSASAIYQSVNISAVHHL